eukprot:6182059-Pleurochrysis_carterae.AAC.1
MTEIIKVEESIVCCGQIGRTLQASETPAARGGEGARAAPCRLQSNKLSGTTAGIWVPLT